MYLGYYFYRRTHMRILIYLTLLFCSLQALGQTDYRFALRARTYPVSALAEADVGQNILLWGKRDGVLYGYLRPSLMIGEIGSYHSGTVALDFFPISFFKLRAGYMREMTNARRSDVECSQVECGGRIDHQFLESNLLLGAKGYFTSIRYRYNSSKRSDGERPFLEFDTMLPMASHRDNSQLLQTVIGKKMSESWSGLYASMLASSQKARGSTTGHYALAMYTKGPWEFAGGPGAFRSSLLDWGFSSVFWVTWSGGDSFALKAK